MGTPAPVELDELVDIHFNEYPLEKARLQFFHNSQVTMNDAKIDYDDIGDNIDMAPLRERSITPSTKFVTSFYPKALRYLCRGSTTHPL